MALAVLFLFWFAVMALTARFAPWICLLAMLPLTLLFVVSGL